MSIEEIFEKESRSKKSIYVRIDETIVEKGSHVFHMDLGSCASVILCGMDNSGTVWFGINHLFKARKGNYDMALVQISDLIKKLKEKNISDIRCLGLFGAGYGENSPAKKVARKNVETILEALSFYDLSIEIFQTGFSQAVTLFASEKSMSILIKHLNYNSKEKNYLEVPFAKIFAKD